MKPMVKLFDSKFAMQKEKSFKSQKGRVEKQSVLVFQVLCTNYHRCSNLRQYSALSSVGCKFGFGKAWLKS